MLSTILKITVIVLKTNFRVKVKKMPEHIL